jgi:hypothetical protein
MLAAASVVRFDNWRHPWPSLATKAMTQGALDHRCPNANAAHSGHWLIFIVALFRTLRKWKT